ncbi:hydrolase 1, exosortase A system-associated [Massilia sp. DWR3-1-1]|uniref:hydrolase 1, exosortase A system-associated n=1 Tax=Massilia sp. DWR3-1-1 TaxID=2804559 RepID=UPI003CFB37BE
MEFEETSLIFPCHKESLVGILTRPHFTSDRGVVIVVGGPQYRAGSHRQFTLLARALAANGIAVMRFDYRGMGDSDGDMRIFDAVGDDLSAAIDTFFENVEEIREVVLWGLCDAASAISMYAPSDKRVTGIILANPWVRTSDGLARSTLKHYYGGRLLHMHFWRKLFRFEVNLKQSIYSLAQSARLALRPRLPAGSVSLPDAMCSGLTKFKGAILIILSGADMTAHEFRDLTSQAPEWRRLLGTRRVTQRTLEKADHTFSRRVWRDQVADWSSSWVRNG